MTYRDKLLSWPEKSSSSRCLHEVFESLLAAILHNHMQMIGVASSTPTSYNLLLQESGITQMFGSSCLEMC